jgi:TonB family protein
MMTEMRPLWTLTWLACLSVAAQAQPKRLPRISATAQNTERVYRIGHGVSAPLLIYKNQPEYSEEARRAGLQGTVAVSFVVGRNGRAQNIKVVQSVGLGLDEKAIQVIQRWKFKPGTKDGDDVSVYTVADFNFCLPGQYCPVSKSAGNSK